MKFNVLQSRVSNTRDLKCSFNFKIEARFGNKSLVLKWEIDLEIKFDFKIAEMLQKSKHLLYVLYIRYIKFYFHYIFHIYVICFVISLLYIYMYITKRILFDKRHEEALSIYPRFVGMTI